MKSYRHEGSDIAEIGAVEAEGVVGRKAAGMENVHRAGMKEDHNNAVKAAHTAAGKACDRMVEEAEAVVAEMETTLGPSKSAGALGMAVVDRAEAGAVRNAN